MSIGGPVDYNRLAQLHKPTDPAAMAAEVRRLSDSGLTAADIASALRISLTTIREMIAATGEEAAEIARRAWTR